MSKIQAAQEAIAAGIGRVGFTVIWELGGCPRIDVNLRRIWLPALPDDAPPETLTHLRAYVDHEVEHHRAGSTEADLHRAFDHSPLARSILGHLEDLRVNERIRAEGRRPGSVANIRDTNRYLTEGILKGTIRNSKCNSIAVAIIAASNNLYGVSGIDYVPYVDNPVVYRDAYRIVHKHFRRALAPDATCAQMANTAIELANLLVTLNAKPKPPEPHGPEPHGPEDEETENGDNPGREHGRGRGKDKKGEGESEGETDDNGGGDTDCECDKGRPDKSNEGGDEEKIVEMLEKARKALEKDLTQRGAYADLPDVPMTYREPTQFPPTGLRSNQWGRNTTLRLNPIDQAIDTKVSALTQRLARAFRGPSRPPMRYQEVGALDRARLARVSVDKQVFKRRAIDNRVNCAVTLLLDVSTSMHNPDSTGVPNIDHALNCIYAVALACEAAGARLEIMAFSSGTPYMLIPYASRTRARGEYRRALRDIGVVCGTDLEDAIHNAAHRLQSRREARRMIVTITDGMPNDLGCAKRQVKRARDEGIEVFGVGIGNEGASCIRESFGRWSVAYAKVSELARFVEVFAQMLEQR
jgi:cobaltochelatase CobT